MKNVVALTLAAATTVGVCACGGETKPKPLDAVTKMRERLKTYKTIDISVSGTQNQKPMTMSMHGPTSGTPSAGSVTVNGQTAQIIQLNGATYIKASAEYFKQKEGPDYSGLLANKWFKQKDTDDDNLLKSMMTGLTGKKPSGKPNTISASDTKVTSDKFNGHDAWKLTTKNGKDTAWLEKGTFDLLKASGSGFGDAKSNWTSETITINKHDEPENVTAPADAIDLTQLGN